MKKIAVALKENGKKLEHFGICEYFVIYKYNEDANTIEYDNVVFSSKNRDEKNQWEKSADSIRDCDIIICEQIGMSAKVEVEKRGFKVIQDKGNIESVLDKFLEIQEKKHNLILP